MATAHGAVTRATELAGAGTPVEQALIEALRARFPADTPAEDCASWNDEYAAAMRDGTTPSSATTATWPRCSPRRWWPHALAALEPADRRAGRGRRHGRGDGGARTGMAGSNGDRPHPGLLHMYVHTMEMSPFPERALRAADQLRDLVPDAGHLVHMPTHIDVLCGNYRDVVTGNRRAIVADRKFLEREGALNFYTLYRCHDYHFTIYGAMFLGQPEPALEAAAELQATLTEELLRIEVPVMADWLEGFVPMRLHVLVRFGMWDEILAEPFPDDAQLYCVTTAMLHYAKGVAHAATGNLAAADEQRRLFREAHARVPDTRYLFNNTCLDALAVAGAMLDGEIEYRRGRFDAAFAHLRRSVELDDNMLYDEPWAWMQPTRHALGALLLEQGHVEQAEAVYRADLGLDSTLSRPCQHPDNVWSLHGFHECLTRLGKQAEADIVRPRLQLAAGPGDGAGAQLMLLPHDARRLSGRYLPPPAATQAIVFSARRSSALTQSSRCSGFVSSSFVCERPRRL